ncbi:MAG: DUF434 domain-containing protein [Kiritimatiellae bacterium]|nr:DUF434 domain-containing protein [Kiritimatiellia bacterium]
MSADKRTHRGAHPEDRGLFAAERVPALRQAVGDLSWLLTRGYALDSALKLAGDRYQLRDRQRTAVRRCACSDQALRARLGNERPLSDAAGRDLYVDGFNLVVTLEAALSGGVILAGRDGCLRDMASVHGSYRSVSETETAILRVGAWLQTCGARRVAWFLDRPVSNSGRLRGVLEKIAAAHAWPWEVCLVFNPDDELVACGGLVVTSDANVLDRGVRWVNLVRALVDQIPHAWRLDLGEQAAGNG